ncbi:hypothetical protein AGMMS49573_07870 [Endomicrobiia bacterium]|nr:hypothetical protein AGMMS49573_07870 [Endomicrobiia bacterium]
MYIYDAVIILSKLKSVKLRAHWCTTSAVKRELLEECVELYKDIKEFFENFINKEIDECYVTNERYWMEMRYQYNRIFQILKVEDNFADTERFCEEAERYQYHISQLKKEKENGI